MNLSITHLAIYGIYCSSPLFSSHVSLHKSEFMRSFSSSVFAKSCNVVSSTFREFLSPAVFLQSNDHLTLKESKIGGASFVNCSAFKGGAIYSQSCVKITNCVFSNCYASIGGSVFLTGVSNGSVETCSFTESEAVSSGGSMLLDNGDVSVNGCSFLKSRSGIVSSIDYWGSTTQVKSTNFTESESSLRYGAIKSVSKSKKSSISYCIFSRCVTETDGACVSLGTMKGYLKLTHCTFRDNRSKDGVGHIGSIGYKYAELHFNSCSFNEDTANLVRVPLKSSYVLDFDSDCIFLGN